MRRAGAARAIDLESDCCAPHVWPKQPEPRAHAISSGTSNMCCRRRRRLARRPVPRSGRSADSPPARCSRCSHPAVSSMASSHPACKRSRSPSRDDSVWGRDACVSTVVCACCGRAGGSVPKSKVPSSHSVAASTRAAASRVCVPRRRVPRPVSVFDTTHTHTAFLWAPPYASQMVAVYDVV